MVKPGRGHVPDDRLLALCLGDGALVRSADQAHVRACRQCAGRLETIAESVDRLSSSLTEWADQALPPERLVLQRRQILQRLDRVGQPARVLTFPSIRRPALSTRSSGWFATRWITAAAAAGLIVGIGAGALFDHRAHVASSRAGRRLTASSATAVRPVSGEPGGRPLNDDEFLSDVEAALNEPSAPELEALAAFTPRIQEISLSVK